MAVTGALVRSSSIILRSKFISFPIFRRFSSAAFRFYFPASPLPSSSSSRPLISLAANRFSNTQLLQAFPPKIPFSSSFCTSDTTPERNTLVNFSLPDADSDAEELENTKSVSRRREVDKSKLPPPYDPFNKKPAIQEPDDPKNLQEVFQNMRSDGLMNSAVKMFDGLSKDGLTHEALELFAQIKDKGHMPDVVAHTAVIEAYANASQTKEAHKVYLRMLASGVLPNAYTYSVLIKALAANGDGKFLAEAKKYIVEMMGKGMRPNAGTYAAVFEAMVKEGKNEEAKEFLEELKGRGFVPRERDVRVALKENRGPVFRTLMNILFG